jgi:hypothetical protein
MSIQELTGMFVAVVASLSSYWVARDYRRRKAHGELNAGIALASLLPPIVLCTLGVMALHESSLHIIVVALLVYWLVVPATIESIQMMRRRM